jgi:probable HAF family extracellular repeat protein
VCNNEGTAPGYTDGAATGVNDFGQASGNADMGSGTGNHGFLYSQGAFDDLGLGYASAINASGQVAGGSNLFTDGQRTVLGSGTTAYGLNDPGQVVGNSVTLHGGNPFLWTPDMPNGTTGHLAILPLLPGENTGTADGINAAGQVVGFCDNQGIAQTYQAFLYSDGTMMNLNDFLPAGSGWQLAQAKAINAAGQIVGTGYLNGDTSVSHGFLLDLNAAPATHGAGFVPSGDLALGQVTAAPPAGTVREPPLAPSSTVLRDQPAGAAAAAVPVVIPGTPVAAGPASTPVSPTPTAVDLSSAADLDLSSLMPA